MTCVLSGRYIDVSTAPGQHFIFSTERTMAGEINPGCIGFSLLQRKWATLSINQDISIKPFHFERSSEVLCSIALEVDFLQKKTYVQTKMAVNIFHWFSCRT